MKEINNNKINEIEKTEKKVVIKEVENELAPELVLFADWETYEDAAME